MKRLKIFLAIFIFIASGVFIQANAQHLNNTNRWSITLPLRFTHLQGSNTMLSGVKLGHGINDRWSAYISIYHSFYLNSFKSPANLPGYSEQPRLFINCMGAELEYLLARKSKFDLLMQLHMGWAFLKYELKTDQFKSQQVNFLSLEPCLNLNYHLNEKTSLGFGLAYRPMLSSGQLSYSSNISSGSIPIDKQFPNGMNLVLSIKGIL